MKSIPLTMLALTIAATSVIADSNNETDLEPAFNGGISSSGLFPSQEMEDRYGLKAASGMEYKERDLEPAFNGGVSASGLFPSQEAEDSANEETKRMLSEMPLNH